MTLDEWLDAEGFTVQVDDWDDGWMSGAKSAWEACSISKDKRIEKLEAKVLTERTNWLNACMRSDKANIKIEELENRISNVEEARKIQGMKGNWDMDEYMRGVYNGLELAMACLEDRDPIYKDSPESEEVPSE
jgi:hypothetical protein